MTATAPAKIVPATQVVRPQVVLDGIDLSIARGKSVVIIGGSHRQVGAAEVLGILRPERGSITVDGEQVIGMRSKDRDRMMLKFGMLFRARLF